MRLFHTIRYCLGAEMKLVAQVENLGNTFITNDKMSIINNSGTEIKQQFGILRQNVNANANFIRMIEEQQEAFALLYHDCTKVTVNLQQLLSQNHQNLESEKKQLKR